MPRKRPAKVSTTELLEKVPTTELRRRLWLEAAKDERLEIRLSPASKKLIERLAKQCGVSVTELIVTLARIADDKLAGR